MDTGVLPVGRFPNVAKRSSCELGSLGSYFFLLSCIWITREIIATMTMQKVSNSSHVTITEQIKQTHCILNLRITKQICTKTTCRGRVRSG